MGNYLTILPLIALLLLVINVCTVEGAPAPVVPCLVLDVGGSWL